MIGFNEEWARKASLADLWREIEEKYTLQVQTGRDQFRAEKVAYLKIYRERGGKKKTPKLRV